MLKRKSMPLTRVIGKVPGNQLVSVRYYGTDTFFNDTPITTNEMANRLDYAMEVREAEVYGISIKNSVLIIDMLID